MISNLFMLSEKQISQFDCDGFIVIENLINSELVTKLASRVEPLFYGNFETGVFPDEWLWRADLNLPHVTRMMTNAWKSDLVISGVVLSEIIGRLTATLAGWSGARLASDNLWVKVPGSKEIAMHQDARYCTYLNPREMMNCWIPLDCATAEVGTIEYVRGSHKWPTFEASSRGYRWADDFDTPNKDYTWRMRIAADSAGIEEPEIVKVEIPSGSCVIHHGDIWHGSGPNISADKIRRSLIIRTIPAQTRFHESGVGHIFGRYKRVGDTTMDESFFPILWTEDGYRSGFLADYCQDALQVSHLSHC